MILGRAKKWAHGALLLVLCLAGCAGRGDATQKSLDELRAQLSHVQADQARLLERVGALETTDQKSRASTESTSGEGDSSRNLRVVRVGADGAPLVEAETKVEPAPSREALSPAKGSRTARAPRESKDFEEALSSFREAQYERALDGFSAFVIRYPESASADQAMFYRAECLWQKGEIARAKEQFEGMISRFPRSKRVPDAMVKVGLCEQRLGDGASAREVFAELRARYPKSDALKQMPKEPQ